MYREEQVVERHLKDRAKSIGGYAFKFTSPGMQGVPDRMLLHKGRVMFLELKTPTTGPTKQQRVMHRFFEGLGFPVKVIRTRQEVDALIRELMK